MVEQGGLLFGSNTADQYFVNRIEYTDNTYGNRRTFVHSPEALNQALADPTWFGIFHTHRLLPWFGIRDLIQARRFAHRIGRSFVLAIVHRDVWRAWYFSPKHRWPRRVQLTIAWS